ncbi:MAG: hypothetical protein DRJ52_05715 [Thermoprotei archaeon]|nr:MAG: hypothetical protein DRJ52_05715 [Thermoprotei archaeon]
MRRTPPVGICGTREYKDSVLKKYGRPNVAKALRLILLGLEAGLYPRSVIRAAHVRRLGLPYSLQSVGLGLKALEELGLLVRLNNCASGNKKYVLRDCPRNCSKCGKCVAEALSQLLRELEEGW